MSDKKGSVVGVGLLTALSRVFGFLRQIVFVRFFGAGEMADVFNFTFNIPNNLRKLLAEGALSSAYIPELSSSLMEDPTRKQARRLLQTLLTFQMLTLIPLMVLFVLFARPIITFLSDFPSLSQTEQSVTLFRFLIFYLLLVSLSSVLMAGLNAVNRFFIPAITPILFSCSVIASVFLFYPLLPEGKKLYSMVIGVLVGGTVQIVFQIPSFLRAQFSLKPSFGFASRSFRKILLRYFPVMLASGIFMLLQLFAHFLASKLPEGSISAMANSIALWELPIGIFSVSIMTVLFPKMSRQACLEDSDGLKTSIEEGISGFIALLIPSSLFLILADRFIVSAVYFRGQFNARNLALTGEVLQAYSVGLIALSVFQFLQRYFYSDHSYGVPFWGAVVVAVTDVGVSLLGYQKIGIVALAWANTIAYTVGGCFLWVIASVRLHGFRIKKLTVTTLKVFVSMIPMVGILLLFRWGMGHAGVDFNALNDLLRIFILIALAVACAIPVLGLYLGLKVEVVSDLFLSRFRRRPQKEEA